MIAKRKNSPGVVLPCGHQVIVVDHFDERFDLIATRLFLLGHSFRHFAWITRDTSDDSVSVTSFNAAIVVRLSRSTPFERLFEGKT